MSSWTGITYFSICVTGRVTMAKRRDDGSCALTKSQVEDKFKYIAYLGAINRARLIASWVMAKAGSNGLNGHGVEYMLGQRVQLRNQQAPARLRMPYHSLPRTLRLLIQKALVHCLTGASPCSMLPRCRGAKPRPGPPARQAAFAARPQCQ